MVSLISLFRPIIEEVDRELGKALSGIFTGSIVRSYLPQVWVFVTEEETVSFIVNGQGKAMAVAGAPNPPDVIISVDHAFISKALETRAKPKFEPKVLEIKFKTSKGETAFGFMRKRLGL